jgi:hypothetical protein
MRPTGIVPPRPAGPTRARRLTMAMTAKRYAARQQAIGDMGEKLVRAREGLPPPPTFFIGTDEGKSDCAFVDICGDLEFANATVAADDVPLLVAWLCEMYPQARRRATAGGR